MSRLRSGPFVLAMRWHEVLFAHWPLPPSAVAPLLPPGLDLETFDGASWIGVVPFRMSGVRPRFVPPIPGLSAFPELNVRTYVRRGGIPGVWFFSLDAASRLAVRAARSLLHLPYRDARMAVARRGDEVAYECRRTDRRQPGAAFAARYRPLGPVRRPPAGTLDHFLVERYALYSADARGRLRRGDILHAPWPLQPAAAEIAVNTMGEPLGLRLPDAPPRLHYAEQVDVVSWFPVRV